MKIVWFAHSLISDWNHGNAHFLRGMVGELQARGHEVVVYEHESAWSVQNLVSEHGLEAIMDFQKSYQSLHSLRYTGVVPELDTALDGADLVIVHEWNDRRLVRAVGEHRRRGGRFRLLFHDTHHRALTAPDELAGDELEHYDGVLAYGEVLKELYTARGWGRRAWTWHEAADVRVFYPRESETEGDLVWIGNWGDEERTAELYEYLIEPVVRLQLNAAVYGVRYPDVGKRALVQAGIAYRGWLANHRVPEVFSQFRVTVHVPRRPYTSTLRGIPTIRPFEALACGIPLVSAPWEDSEGLFTEGRDYLVAKNGNEMTELLHRILSDRDQANELATNGRATILARHTCGHRVDELIEILGQLEGDRLEIDQAA